MERGVLSPSLRLHWPLFFHHSPLPSCFGFVADSQAGADGLTFSGKAPCVDSSWASLGASCSVFAPEGRLCRSQAPWHGRSAASVPSWDKIPILSFVESSMTRLESCPTIRSWLTSGVGSPLSPSPQPPDVTSHLSSAICHPPFAIRHPFFPIPRTVPSRRARWVEREHCYSRRKFGEFRKSSSLGLWAGSHGRSAMPRSARASAEGYCYHVITEAI